MAEWSPQYLIDFTAMGDTTAEAIQKHINEISKVIFPLMNRLRRFDAGPTPPTDPVENSFWLDTSALASGGNAILKRFDGASWESDVAIPNSDTVDGYHAQDLLDLSILRANPIVEAEFPFGAHSAGFTLQSYINGETTLDWRNGNKQKYRVLGNVSLSFINPSNVTNLALILSHAVSGASVTFPSIVRWPNDAAPDFTDAVAGDTDIVTFLFDGTYYYGMYARKFQ
jgi:hypothetical protein